MKNRYRFVWLTLVTAMLYWGLTYPIGDWRQVELVGQVTDSTQVGVDLLKINRSLA